ncbi:hypothetical protein CCACVL1_02301 [Corchorus capsularis]|uniref:Uncharacterized protein n=1 Tax=Corchorus capsularis TaxID=210143 RepID=A0A1R3K9F0_COCAP|nr:hypothetical protein CCACVL1_02301 [Corchorus capsularis]
MARRWPQGGIVESSQRVAGGEKKQKSCRHSLLSSIIDHCRLPSPLSKASTKSPPSIFSFPFLFFFFLLRFKPDTSYFLFSHQRRSRSSMATAATLKFTTRHREPEAEATTPFRLSFATTREERDELDPR